VHGFDLGATAAGRLAAVMRRERVTAFMLVLSALSATLRHWTGQPDVVIGSSFSGRTHQDLEQLIGPMVSTVALRMTPHPAATGSELLRASRRAVLDAQAHADLPFERLVQHLRPRRSATSHPVFQVNLGVRSAPSGRLDLAGLTVTSADPRSTRPARFDLSVYVDTGVDAWPVAIEYNTGLFEAATVARLGEALRDALHGLAEHPERLLSGFSFADLPVGQEAVPEPLPRLAARTASCDEFERQVAFAFTQVLGGPELTAADDFFARGGHSMAGMLVVDRLRAMTGRRIDLPALFRHPTVAGLAAVLRETRPESSDPFVVPLATAGSRPPLILTPPALGQLAMYFPLVSALGADRPVLGVQPDGFYRTGDPGDMPLREQAAVYATEIASELPVTGPYHLCGFSAAGRLAVAIADELVRLEKRVGAVILLDSAPYGDLAPDPDLAGVIARWMSFAPPAEHLRALSPDAMIAATLKAGQAVGALPATMDQDAMTQWCRRLEFGARALAGHGPLHYPGVVTLLHRARRSDRRITAEWDAMPIGGLQPVPVIVESHEGFMAGPVLPEVARLIGELLAAADTA
jgi:thioesterase domain-containing protein